MSSDQQDRIAGALVGLAAGDALGAGYEFGTPPEDEADMIGGGLGPWAPGEWTDDTQMAVCVAEAAAPGAVDVAAVGERFLRWFAAGPKDVGTATRAVLGAARSGADLSRASRDHLERNPGGAAGNGALMRTAPVALAHLGDDEAIANTARAVAELTHADALAGDSCVLWCTAIDRAVREERLDGAWDGLGLLPAERRRFWHEALEEAASSAPATFRPNGFTVAALQAAAAAIVQTPVPGEEPSRHLRAALHAAVRIGDDTDTVAAIAGSLLGARWGASAVPEPWRRLLHGWPGLDADDLAALALRVAGA